MDRKSLRIAILEKSAIRRQFIRNTLADSGLQPVCFENFLVMLENLGSLAPAGAIIGDSDPAQIPLYVEAVKDAMTRLPVLAIRPKSQDSLLQEKSQTSQISWISLNSDRDDIVASIKKGIVAVDQEHLSNVSIPPATLIGISPEVQLLKDKVRKLHGLIDNILVSGEKGCGKEQLARYIHFSAKETGRQFIKVRCGDLDARIFEKEVLPLLNSLTGLKSNHTGTILLDEIDALSHELQTLLMGQFAIGKALADPEKVGSQKVGSQKEWRIIATTRMNLNNWVNEGRFRADLFYRLSVISFKLAPLRQRKDDIPFLTDYFLYHFCRRWGRAFMDIPEEIKSLMLDYSWPGNIDELIERISAMVDAQSIDPLFTQPWFREQIALMHAGSRRGIAATEPHLRKSLEKQLDETDAIPLKAVSDRYLAKLEKRIISHVLDATHWNRKKAAAMMDISYKSVLNKIRDYGLT